MKKIILSSAAALLLTTSVGTFAGIQGSGLLGIEGSGLQAADLLLLANFILPFLY